MALLPPVTMSENHEPSRIYVIVGQRGHGFYAPRETHSVLVGTKYVPTLPHCDIRSLVLRRRNDTQSDLHPLPKATSG